MHGKKAVNRLSPQPIQVMLLLKLVHSLTTQAEEDPSQTILDLIMKLGRYPHQNIKKTFDGLGMWCRLPTK
jgi:hypothetical protein